LRVVTGTPLYMAPEVIAGEPATAASDVYSLGVLLYHLVTRDYPVSGATFAEVREAHAKGERTPLVTVRPDLPEAFVAVVERAIAPAVADRYPTAAALHADLQRLLPSVAPPAPALPKRVAAALVVTLGSAVVVGIVLGVIGFITTRGYGGVLARPETFATEGLFDFVRLGAQATVMPGVVAALGLLVINGLRLVVRPLRSHVAVVGRLAGRVSAWRARLLGSDLDVRTSLAAAIALLGAAMVFWGFQPMLVVLTGSVNDAPAPVLEQLSKAHISRHYAYRLATTGLLLFVAWAVVGITHASQRPGARRPALGPLASLAAGAIVVVVLHAALWRVLYTTRNLRLVTVAGQSCVVLAENTNDALVTCPSSPPPRNRTVSRVRLQESGQTLGWLFDAFRPDAASVVHTQ
jgi:hypothetical protein